MKANASSVLLAIFLPFILVAVGLSMFFLGIAVAPSGTSAPPVAAGASTYYCTMHPHITLDRPGKCSICGMDLVPRTGASSDAGPRTLVLSEAAAALADVATTPVERRIVQRRVPMVGKITFDETQVKTITSWVDGRLDRLYVDYTGIPIKKGDHLVEIYSPKLVAAQQELLEEVRAARRMNESQSELLRDASRGTLAAVREKLRRLGLTTEQIADLEKQDEPSDHIVINAPMEGVVVEKLANQGDYVSTGTPIYKIAELAHLWVQLDAYESDLPWLRYGQEVRFETESFPGELFRGRINFIDWVVDPLTRTVKVRVNVENRDGRLKPGMFVRAEVISELAESGRVMAPYLVGKWVSPMHPEIVKDGPGSCDICGMALVPAEDLYGKPTQGERPPLVIPASAPLITGERAVVYVRKPGEGPPTFQGREIVLGPRAGESYIVKHGLEEGERVVTRGNFKIDSALQIEAKPSMMHPSGGGGATGHDHGQSGAGTQEPQAAHAGHDDAATAPGPADGSATADSVATTPPESARPPAQPLPGPSSGFRKSLAGVYEAYIAAGEALASDDGDAARSAFEAMESALQRVAVDELAASARAKWQELLTAARDALNGTPEDVSLDLLRRKFGTLSDSVREIEQRFGHSGGFTFREVYCPMAFQNQGGTWLQTSEKVLNPYFGASMLTCGSVKATYPPRAASGDREGGADDAK